MGTTAFVLPKQNHSPIISFYAPSTRQAQVMLQRRHKDIGIVYNKQKNGSVTQIHKPRVSYRVLLFSTETSDANTNGNSENSENNNDNVVLNQNTALTKRKKIINFAKSIAVKAPSISSLSSKAVESVAPQTIGAILRDVANGAMEELDITYPQNSNSNSNSKQRRKRKNPLESLLRLKRKTEAAFRE